MSGAQEFSTAPGSQAGERITYISPSFDAAQHSGHLDTHRARQSRFNRSCTECNRRKVRCDRYQPCNHCTKAGSSCVFPSFRRPPIRRAKAKPRDDELLTHLKSLERKIQSLVEDEDGDTLGTGSNEEALAAPDLTEQDSVQHLREAASQAGSPPENVDESARLMHGHGRSRYIANNVWTGMVNEIDEMRDILDASSPEQGDEFSTPGSVGPSRTNAFFTPDSFVFHPTVSGETLRSIFPSSTHLLALFDVFLENVDPVVRVFHRSMLHEIVRDAVSNPERLDRYTELVIFSVCFASVTSLDEAKCLHMFGEEHQVMVKRHRFAVEQSLSRARFLNSQNLTVLAALVLFLVCVRRHDNSRFVSSLLGIVIRNAQSLGLHRDGSHLGLSPFEVEVRRRIWWQICVLDLRASEDHGSDPSIFDFSYDTKFPLNINDDDISPNDTKAPPERPGTSEMTFCLLRFEVTLAIRQLTYHPPGAASPPKSVAEKQEVVESLNTLFHNKYIRHCDITKPFEWVSSTWASLMLAKMWLTISQSLYRHGDPKSSNYSQSRNLAFIKAIEVLELSDVLETSPRAKRWGWLFLTHVQWHAVILVLAELCENATNPSAARAWEVIDKVYSRWSSQINSKKGMLWKPLRQLMNRAYQLRTDRQTPTEKSNTVSTMDFPGPLEHASPQIEPLATVHQPQHTQQPLMPSQLGQFEHQPSAETTTSEPNGFFMGPPSMVSNNLTWSQNAIEQSSSADFSTNSYQEINDSGDFNRTTSSDFRTFDAPASWSEWDRAMYNLQMDYGNQRGRWAPSSPNSNQDPFMNLWDML